LSFTAPIAMLQAPTDSSRWFVVQQGGVVRTFANAANTASATNFVSIADRVIFQNDERGLLGMAFHPNFPTNPRVYLSYTAQPAGTSRVSEFQSRDNGATLDPASELILLTVPQPASNHNGGNIAFGPDGFLYIGFGDGGGGGDPFGAIGNGQNLQTLLGKMLRIDIGGATNGVPYRIPPGNPFSANALCNNGSGTQNCPEIYAYGLRNPWRWSFDRGSGELWLADVGQGSWEEVNRISLGGNYGWRCREGAHVYAPSGTPIACGPNPNPIDPIAEYGRSVGQSVTGGYVYRGAAIPALVGRYVFADFATGRLWHIARDTAPTLQVTSGLDTGLNVSSFAEAIDGEIYVVHYSGTLHRLIAGAASGATVATQLSATGCVNPSNATQPAAGLIPYQPNAPFWSDGANKQRYIGLPDGQQITVNANQDFDFPNRSVLVKNFQIGSRLIETRLFMRHTDGVWAGYTYEWNGQNWVFPSEAQCLSCHTAAAGRSLGLEIAQLNGNFSYTQTGRTANQLVTLNAIQTLTPALTQTPNQLPALPDPYGTGATLSERARAYLHTNCANCHQPSGGTPSNLDLRYTTTLLGTQACDAPPQAGDLGIGNARLIAPGDAARSVLVARVNRRDGNAMPPLSSTVVDAAGSALLSSWVNSLAGCN
jgi:glucose/arabinose dehydrogenase/mono/diheme cytochrome c family protein